MILVSPHSLSRRNKVCYCDCIESGIILSVYSITGVSSGSGETSWFTTTDFPAHVDHLHQDCVGPDVVGHDKLFEAEYSVSEVY